MDKRLFFLGLGTGLIAATLVIAGGNSLLPKAETPAAEHPQQEQPATQTDWRQAAKEAGMVVLPEDDYQKQLAGAKADGAQQKEAELKKNTADSGVFIYIQPGMGTTDVAILLQASGVLQDGNRLIALRENWPNPIRSGTYQLKKNSDPQEVLKTIATPPSQ
ncbi:hypothetical protein EV586_10149 [Tumebacillus sp. BK434]|uniref:hypothetical protein n=1 Tax=Tumebacillus sp. BK434 TaxID=2512169 RepID=UPI00104BFFE8|nr:hypothetical protein [Tumebacillus sp. BK434]TCP58850.1 hypothetical protein EV586_10149 [Tumebacillus sp. BK434]